MTERVLTDSEILAAYGKWDGFYATLDAVRRVEAAVLGKVPKYLWKLAEYKEGGYTMTIRDTLRGAARILEGESANRVYTLCASVTSEMFKPKSERRPLYEVWVGDATPQMVEKLEREGYCVVLLNTKQERDTAQIGGFVTEREARKREVLAKREGWDACIRELNAYCTSGPDQKWWNRADFQRGRDIRYPLPITLVPRTVVLSDGTKVWRDGSEWKAQEVYQNPNGKFPYHSLFTDQAMLSFAKTPADARVLASLVERPYDDVPEP